MGAGAVEGSPCVGWVEARLPALSCSPFLHVSSQRTLIVGRYHRHSNATGSCASAAGHGEHPQSLPCPAEGGGNRGRDHQGQWDRGGDLQQLLTSRVPPCSLPAAEGGTVTVTVVVPRHIVVPRRRSVCPCQEEGWGGGVRQAPGMSPYGTVVMAELCCGGAPVGRCSGSADALSHLIPRSCHAIDPLLIPAGCPRSCSVPLLFLQLRGSLPLSRPHQGVSGLEINRGRRPKLSDCG